ncbi:ribonuclease III [Siccirubricoccus phaeus]|uniref:ribonuclease III n=1 Tax=Siccirubricoccus phaeus TaxID=2595053 RepID=UPI0011F3045F|nr:ribonuclease III [Siccirubricoccus phaeus]
MARKKQAEPAAAPDFEELARRIGHEFRNPALLRQALTHRSAGDPQRGQLDSNERLEFLGDRVLALLMAEWLGERFPEEREGTLMRRFGVLVAWDTLARVAEAEELGRYVMVAPGEGRSGLATRQNVLADALEAVLGALFLDGGLDAARPYFRRAFAGEIEAGPERPQASPKSRLQEWLQGRGHGLPEYRLVSTAGPPHQPVFVVTVTAAGRSAEGVGDTKRAAEQRAAEAWLGGVNGG